MDKFFKQKNKKVAGFTLVEALIGISIFSVSVLAMMSILATGVSDINYAKRKMIAGYLNQEGIEYIRNLRDTYAYYDPAGGWTNFKSYLMGPNRRCHQTSGCYVNSSVLTAPFNDPPMKISSLITDSGCSTNYCPNLFYDSVTGKYGYGSGVDSGFSRKIKIDIINDDETRVTSTVSWSQGSGGYSVTFSEVLSNWIE